MEQGVGNELVSLFIRKEITRLYKTFLETIEDIKSEHTSMKMKVSKHCAPEFAEDINYFDENKHGQLRKRTLDAGNEAIRQIDNHLGLFDFKINEEKVKLASQRKITFKVTTHSTLYENK